MILQFLRTDKVLVADVVLRDDLLLKTTFFVFILVFILLIVLVTFTLIVCVLMVDAIVEVLVVELLILAVEFADSSVEPNGHIFVYEHTLYLLIDGFGHISSLGVERTQNDRATRVILHQCVVIRVDGVLGKLGVQVLWLPFPEQLL